MAMQVGRASPAAAIGAVALGSLAMGAVALGAMGWDAVTVGTLAARTGPDPGALALLLAHLELAPGQLAPGLAPVAIQQGQAAAKNVLATIHGRPREPFRYHDKGIMATIGKHRAIVQTRHVRIDGYVAWVVWLLVHILYLVGFRNRIAVFLQWVWSYLFSKRGSRLIESWDS